MVPYPATDAAIEPPVSVKELSGSCVAKSTTSSGVLRAKQRIAFSGPSVTGQTHQGSGESVTRPTTGQLQPLKDTEPDNPKPSAALPRVASLTNERQEKKCKGRHRTAAGPRVRGSAGGIGVSASAPRTARNQTEPMQRITTASRSLPPCRAVVAGPALRDTDTRDAPPVRHGFSFSHSARGHRLAALASRI